MPGINSAHLGTMMLQELGGGTVIGPLLVGLSKPAQVVQIGASVSDIVATAALSAYDSLL
jgi:malate dehydrogenase (oxaloacetate-decarboxylating)(NADP+)